MAVLVQHCISGRGQDAKITGKNKEEQRYDGFLAWLQRNGAQFDGIEWPCTTENGIRGAVARKDIATGVRGTRGKMICHVLPFRRDSAAADMIQTVQIQYLVIMSCVLYCSPDTIHFKPHVPRPQSLLLRHTWPRAIYSILERAIDSCGWSLINRFCQTQPKRQTGLTVCARFVCTHIFSIHAGLCETLATYLFRCALVRPLVFEAYLTTRCRALSLSLYLFLSSSSSFARHL